MPEGEYSYGDQSPSLLRQHPRPSEDHSQKERVTPVNLPFFTPYLHTAHAQLDTKLLALHPGPWSMADLPFHCHLTGRGCRH